ncbi:MAG: Fe-S cluster assembly sulfur transfer protein SufU [Saprospiraceae bacterium]
MNNKLKQLYKTVILKHNNAPFNYEKKETATHQLEAYNPLCGDRFNLFLEVNNGVIESIHFHGYGCAISKASTSVLAKNLEGKTMTQALALCGEFQQVVSPDNTTENEQEELEAFAAAKDFPGRLTCATLSWEAIQTFLVGKD